MTTITNNTNNSMVGFHSDWQFSTILPLTSFQFSPNSQQNFTLGSNDTSQSFSPMQTNNLLFLFWRGMPMADQNPDGSLLVDNNGNLITSEGNFIISGPISGNFSVSDPSTGNGNGNGDNNRTRNIIIFIVIFIIIIIIIIIIIVIAKGGKKSDSDDLSALEGLQLEQ